MKANAPEKLYLSKNIYSTYLYQVPDPDDETIVEYIRTDAFIEKASEWFKIRYEWIDIDGTRNYDKSAFEDFKNYMKGE
jgi:hypothetical protein